MDNVRVRYTRGNNGQFKIISLQIIEWYKIMSKAHYKSVNLEVKYLKSRVLDGEKTNHR